MSKTKKLIASLLIINTIILSGCTPTKVSTDKKITQEEISKEDLSVEVANKIIEEYEKTGNLEVAEEVLNEFMKDEKYHIATKTQLLEYFIPQFRKVINSKQDFFEKNYFGISKLINPENGEEETTIDTFTRESILLFFDELEDSHGKIYTTKNLGYLLSLDWGYFIDTYKDDIDPYFVEILNYYKDNVEVVYRNENKEIEYDVLIDKIIIGEELIAKRENDLYLNNVTTLLEVYYKDFFGNNETTLFDSENKLTQETLKLFYNVLDNHPDSQLAKIITGYLNEIKDENGDYVKNTFGTVYLMEKIGGNIQYFEYDENGEYIQQDLTK